MAMNMQLMMGMVMLVGDGDDHVSDGDEYAVDDGDDHVSDGDEYAVDDGDDAVDAGSDGVRGDHTGDDVCSSACGK